MQVSLLACAKSIQCSFMHWWMAAEGACQGVRIWGGTDSFMSVLKSSWEPSNGQRLTWQARAPEPEMRVPIADCPTRILNGIKCICYCWYTLRSLNVPERGYTNEYVIRNKQVYIYANMKILKRGYTTHAEGNVAASRRYNTYLVYKVEKICLDPLYPL